VILDFGSHRVGYFSFYVGADGVNIDAPAKLKLTFGEIPYDVLEELHPCNSWISSSWIPEEILHVDWVPTNVSMPQRYSFRYVRIQVLDTSPKFKIFLTNIQVRRQLRPSCHEFPATSLILRQITRAGRRNKHSYPARLYANSLRRWPPS
jgi:hypothetical protein